MLTLDGFPFDVFFEISTNLDLEDVVHLSMTCRHLRALLLNDTVAHRVVEIHHPHTEEARQARQRRMSYGEAMCAIYDRRHAFSTAQPFSARVVCEGSSFLYRQGVLCVQNGHTVIVYDLRSGTPAVTIDIPLLFKGEHGFVPNGRYKMKYYNDGILAVHVTSQHGDKSLLKFIKTSNNLSYVERDAGFIVINDSSKLFVRHTAQYACLGTHSGEGRDGHRKWVVCTYDMDLIRTNIEFGEAEIKKVLLDDFHGNDIGSTVVFEIHNGYFYAVSNQGTYEVQEVDWTSFYHCVRFPLNRPVEEAMQKDTRVYRRQHAEGAIHDSWTDLTLQHDEQTNDLFVVEARREWVGASSKQARTFYTSRISFPSNSAENDGDSLLPLPDDDILTSLLESSHCANYLPTPKQYSWTRHPEIPPKPSHLPSPRSFILARTKFRAYNFSCSAFLDLVEDSQCCPNRSPALQPCLKLRIGSRRVAPQGSTFFGYESEKKWGKSSVTQNSRGGEHVHFEDNTQYRYNPIRMWPPPSPACPCSQRLHRIMNPDTMSTHGTSSSQKTTTAVCDERSIVYMVKPGKSYSYHDTDSCDLGLGKIVLVDFGRSPIPSQSQQDDVARDMPRWDWTPGYRKKCSAGTC